MRKRKPTAAENKLNALLGLTSKAEEVKANGSTGLFYGVSEAEMQDFRSAQGLIYFLQAPELFHPKTCKFCKEPFIVSRMFVACCSYTCIRKDLERRGFKWEKGRDLEQVILDPQVYNGNEPIWVREPQLSRALDILTNLLQKGSDSTSNLQSTPPETVQSEPPSSLTTETTETLSSASSTIVQSNTTKPSSKTKKPKRVITFGT